MSSIIRSIYCEFSTQEQYQTLLYLARVINKVNSVMILIQNYISLLFSVLWLSAPGSFIIASGQMTTVKVLERGNDWQCPSVEERERARNEINQVVTAVISSQTVKTCNGTPGWRCIAFINMTDTSYHCPAGLNLTSHSKRTCGRSHTQRKGCSSTNFSIGGLSYSRVCGRIRGYQFGATDGLHNIERKNIDGFYTNGISLTHGGVGRRQHIWTFIAGISEISANYFSSSGCPCDTFNYGIIPGFIGNDYFCESGVNTAWRTNLITFYPNDVLWDGQDCTPTSMCCQLNNPPWFTKNLPTATTDDIELRLCTDYEPNAEDIPLELIELYVQ